jgi:hypothetical protein
MAGCDLLAPLASALQAADKWLVRRPIRPISLSGLVLIRISQRRNSRGDWTQIIDCASTHSIMDGTYFKLKVVAGTKKLRNFYIKTLQLQIFRFVLHGSITPCRPPLKNCSLTGMSDLI